jgi:hypothetical protein
VPQFEMSYYVSFASLFMNPAFVLSRVSLHLWCVAALTRHSIITSSVFKFCASLADDTCLLTCYPFSFLIYIHFTPEDTREHFNGLLFLYNRDEAPVTPH